MNKKPSKSTKGATKEKTHKCNKCKTMRQYQIEYARQLEQYLKKEMNNGNNNN